MFVLFWQVNQGYVNEELACTTMADHVAGDRGLEEDEIVELSSCSSMPSAGCQGCCQPLVYEDDLDAFEIEQYPESIRGSVTDLVPVPSTRSREYMLSRARHTKMNAISQHHPHSGEL